MTDNCHNKKSSFHEYICMYSSSYPNRLVDVDYYNVLFLPACCFPFVFPSFEKPKTNFPASAATEVEYEYKTNYLGWSPVRKIKFPYDVPPLIQSELIELTDNVTVLFRARYSNSNSSNNSGTFNRNTHQSDTVKV